MTTKANANANAPGTRGPDIVPPAAPERLDAVLFDAGMTLLRPARAVEHIYAEHARKGEAVSPELREEIRRHFRELFEEERRKMATGEDGFVASDEADHALWMRLCLAVSERIPGLTPDPLAWFETLYAEFGKPETWRTFPDAMPTLEGLADRGVSLGIVSNWDSRLLGILEGFGITALMGTQLVSAQAGVRKPGPQIFAMALEALDVAPEHTLMVGDSVTDDVKGAWAAGLHAVLIHRNPSVEPPPGIPVLRTLTELLDWPALAPGR